MILRTRFFQAKGSNPEGVVLDRLNDWRKENPNVAILGVQWTVLLTNAACDVTYETPEKKTGNNGETR